jgi:hypothetical protein
MELLNTYTVSKSACLLLLAGFILDLLFNPEDGSSMFLQNTNGLLLDYIALHPR